MFLAKRRAGLRGPTGCGFLVKHYAQSLTRFSSLTYSQPAAASPSQPLTVMCRISWTSCLLRWRVSMQHMHTGPDLEIHHIIHGTSVPALRELVPV